MPPSLPKFASKNETPALLHALGEDFAVVKNLAHVFPPYELYPLAPPQKTVGTTLRAAVMDMDGTTTTTEPLCINALETMIGRISGRLDDPDWPGLDAQQDYPHIIGNSSTRHVEYLLETYRDTIRPEAFMEALIHSAAWTLGHSPDESRRRDLTSMLDVLGMLELCDDPRFQKLSRASRYDDDETREAIRALAAERSHAFPATDFPRLTRASVEIYYQRYHELLAAVAKANGAPLPARLRAPSDGLLIQPMPGIGIYLALVSGLLGEAAPAVLPRLTGHLAAHNIDTPADAEARMRKMGVHFTRNPAKVALVTSSIAYEAEIVLGEVFRQLHDDVADWGISDEAIQRIQTRFKTPDRLYDAIITASDSCEMRLKPHRDLYSLALGRIGLHPDEFGDVVGFEDSESGTIAIRAAGISVCCALPFHMTTGHIFQAATHTCAGGLPEVILGHQCFLKHSALEDGSPS